MLVQTSHPTRTDGLDAAALAKLGPVQVATRTLKLTARAALGKSEVTSRKVHRLGEKSAGQTEKSVRDYGKSSRVENATSHTKHLRKEET